MRIAVVLSCNLFFIVTDTIITTILYIHGSKFHMFADEMARFDILCSSLDLWGTVLVRFALLLGASIGVLWNRVDGPQRVSKLSTLTTLLCLVVMTYALTKLLIFSEQEALMHDQWFLSLVSWSCVSAVGTMCLWSTLAKTSNSVSDSGGGGGEGEAEWLVDALEDSSSDQEGVEGKTQTGKRKNDSKGGAEENSDSSATVGRLLSYCRKDALLLSVAFFFLILSAVCKWHISHCDKVLT